MVNTVCRAPFLLSVCPNKRASLSAMRPQFNAFVGVYQRKKLLTRKIFVKFLPKPRTDGEKVSFYKWRGYQKEVMLMRWKMAMSMRKKKTRQKKFLWNFCRNHELTAKKCPFISEEVIKRRWCLCTEKWLSRWVQKKIQQKNLEKFFKKPCTDEGKVSFYKWGVKY